MAPEVDRNGRDRVTADYAWMIISHLLAGIVMYGGIGWLLRLWLGHRGAFVAAGVIIGSTLSLYLVHVKVSRLDSEATATDKERQR